MIILLPIVLLIATAAPRAVLEFDCPPSCDTAAGICSEMVRYGGIMEHDCSITSSGLELRCICNGIEQNAPEFVQVSGGRCVLTAGSFPPSPHSPLGLTCTVCTTDEVPHPLCENLECNFGCCGRDGTCQCWNTNQLGHWQGPNCNSCQPQWSLPTCTEKSLTLTAIFGGSPSALPAIIPFFVVTYVYLCFTGCRRRWSHEQPPTLRPDVTEAFAEKMEDRLRKLRTIDESSSMYIPPRNPKSKGMKNSNVHPHRVVTSGGT